MSNRDFLGIHSHRWPYGADGKPPFDFGLLRTHDMEGPNGAGVTWQDVEKKPGVYDWSVLDPLFTLAGGMTFAVLFTFNNAPSFYPVAQLGAKAAAFATAMRNRYGALVKFFEVGNEPDFTKPAWWGTCANLINIAAGVFDAVAPLGAIVLSPGITSIDGVKQYFNTVDPVSNRNAASTCHGIAIHNYLAWPTPADAINNLSFGDMGYQTVKTALAGTGAIDHDLYVTEFGFDWHVPPTYVTDDFQKRSDAYRADRIYRTLTEAQRIGFKAYCIYAYGDLLTGDLQADVNGVIAGINQFLAAAPSVSVTQSITGLESMNRDQLIAALQSLLTQVQAAPVVEAPEVWTKVATENATFHLATPAYVRYGDPATNRFEPAQVMSGDVFCGNSTFGDPALGVTKTCQVSSKKPT